MNKMNIRRIIREEIEGITHQWVKSSTGPNDLRVIVKKGDAAVGVSTIARFGDSVYNVSGEDVQHTIMGLAVPPKHQGKGYGNILMDLTIEKARELTDKLYLIVSETNEKAINLYKKKGFKDMGPHPKYTRNRVMVLDL